MKSKKIIINAITVCLFVASMFQSCADITDMQSEWLDQGETLYVGRLDSLKFRGGLKRVQMEGLLTYSRSATNGIITWKDKEVKFNIDNVSQDGVARVLIDNLEEGTYRFFVQTFDKEGNKSLKEECYGYVYGDEYKLTQSPKVISEMKQYPEKILLTWNISDDAVKVVLSYENKAGKISSLTLPGNVKETAITDWKIGGKIEAQTYTLPEKNAIDTIGLDVNIQVFPPYLEYEVNKDTFKAAPLKTDSKGNGYGGKIEGMWDGIMGSGEAFRYHSDKNEGVPHHLTFDMGVYADLTRFKIDGREDHINWNPKRFQLWGIDSLDGAETSLPSTNAGWEDEAKAKGWKLLIDATNSDTKHNSYNFDKDNVKNVRYIRYRVMEVFGPPSIGTDSFGCVQELTFWADNQAPIK